MKQLLVLISVSAGILFTACKQGRYYDLTAGEYIEVEKDDQGRIVNSDTHEPVYIYVDTKTKDTIYGPTGEVINGRMIKSEDGKYTYGDLKIKQDEDGDFKLKDGDYKKKIDADGDAKTKDDDAKKKTDADGEVKNK